MGTLPPGFLRVQLSGSREQTGVLTKNTEWAERIS